MYIASNTIALKVAWYKILDIRIFTLNQSPGPCVLNWGLFEFLSLNSFYYWSYIFILPYMYFFAIRNQTILYKCTYKGATIHVLNIYKLCFYLASRDFSQEKQSDTLTESPLSKYEGGRGTTPFTLLHVSYEKVLFDHSDGRVESMLIRIVLIKWINCIPF